VIDDERSKPANGNVPNRGKVQNDQTTDSDPVAPVQQKPILKNGPNSSQLLSKKPTEAQRLTAITREMDMFVKQ